jgi:hypothetical protein
MHVYFLEPESYYQADEFRRAGYHLVYYYGLDPYYLHQSFSDAMPALAQLQLDFMFLLMLSDVVILSPSATLGPLFSRRDLQHFLAPFWQDNSITTSIWHNYQKQLQGFVFHQLSGQPFSSAHLQACYQFLRPRGYEKALFVRNPFQQSLSYHRLFEQTYRQLFLRGRHDRAYSTDWSAPAEARRLREDLQTYVVRLQGKDKISLNRAHLMQALGDPQLVADYPAFITQMTQQITLFLYFLMGARANACYLYPQVPEALRWNLPPELLQEAGTHLNATIFWRWLQRYHISPELLLKELDPVALQQLRHREKDLLLRFRRAFRAWVGVQHVPALTHLAPVRNLRAGALIDRLCDAFSGLCDWQQAVMPQPLQVDSESLPPQGLSQTQQLIWTYLAAHSDCPTPTQQLAQVLCLNPDTVRQSIHHMQKKGVAIKHGRFPHTQRGYWLESRIGG